MAISILTIPAIIAPVYNPMYIQVESDKTSEEAFNFIFDLYINGNFIVRDRLLPRPATIQAIYSPARILESYVSFDKSHNYVGLSASTNCIDKYSIVCGEEYINPWRFYDNSYSSIVGFTFYTEFYMTGSTSNPYVTGDKVYVVQDSGFTSNIYNGTFTVLTATSTSIVVDMLHTVNTPVNGGLIYYSDRRKTIYTGTTELLPDPEFLNQAYWSSYGPDASGNAIALNGFGQLNWTQYSASTFLTKYTQASAVTFTTGVSYIVTYEVYDTYPALGLQTSFVVLGDTIGITHSGTGIFTESIICGSGNDLKLYGNSTGTGLQGITFNSISVTQQPITGYSFNGVIQYEEIPTWDYTKYKMTTGTTGSFLTNQPLTIKTRLGERGSMGWMSIQDYIEGAEYYMVIITTNLEHTPTYPLLFNMNSMAENGFTGDTNDLILNWGVYPFNLNDWTQSIYGIDAVNETTESYIAQIFILADPIGDPSNYIPISEQRTFLIDQECTKYEPVRFMFLNALGQFDYFTATLLSRENININKTTYQKTLAYDYSVGDRGKTVLNVAGQQSYTVTSNWITEDTCTWLMELFLSQEVYVLNSDGSLMPIIIDNTSVEPKKRVNDKLLNYTFNYTKAIIKNTQRN